MKILFVGEIVAKPGRQVVSEVLPKIIKKEKPDVIFANGENLAHGRGATSGTINEMKELGIDYFTSGEHLFWHRGFEDEIDDLPILRPANYPESVPGKGYVVVKIKNQKVLLINVISQPFLEEPLENPFLTVDQILEEHKDENISAVIVDFHAEFTSDKYAMGFYLDGRVDAVVGTHTHVPTCDERAFPKGTMYVTDVGMCGIIDSVIGVKKEIIINRVVHLRKQRFEWEDKGSKVFRSVILDTDKKEIRRLDEYIN